ncbi:hypothetical protein [Bordetella bronchialis]|uniref:hypothetical protein n=1 Tax=Bordetella bronchialis TaxID=463025 RepID=UPI000A56F852|nr:hypothetical protein [Bordetella bronchialis]
MKTGKARQAVFFLISVLAAACHAAYADETADKVTAEWLTVNLTFTNSTGNDYELKMVSLSSCPVRDLPDSIPVAARSADNRVTVVTQVFKVQYCGSNKSTDFAVKWRYRAYTGLGLLTIEERFWEYSFKGPKGALKAKFSNQPDPDSHPLFGPLLQRNGIANIESVTCGPPKTNYPCNHYAGSKEMSSVDLRVEVGWVGQAYASVAGYASNAARSITRAGSRAVSRPGASATGNHAVGSPR